MKMEHCEHICMEYSTTEGRLGVYTGRSGEDGTLNIYVWNTLQQKVG